MNRPCVLVFAGLDPSGGAGLHADITAIAAQGAHPLAIATTLTVQDNDRVAGIHPVDTALLTHQAEVLLAKISVAAIKIGIVGNRANAEAIAGIIDRLRDTQPALPVVLDPVLASGHGDALTRDDAVRILAPLRMRATLITPNLPEAHALTGEPDIAAQARVLLEEAPFVLIKGGHGEGGTVINRVFARAASQATSVSAETNAAWMSTPESTVEPAAKPAPIALADTDATVVTRSWEWPRLPGEFHGSGCTLASAIAARLAVGESMTDALDAAQTWCQSTLARAYAIAPGQRIPDRTFFNKDCS